jgi:hypothetical protein
VGQRIEARFGGRGKFYPGRVATVHFPGNAGGGGGGGGDGGFNEVTYLVRFDDGDKEDGVREQNMRDVDDDDGGDDDDDKVDAALAEESVLAEDSVTAEASSPRATIPLATPGINPAMQHPESQLVAAPAPTAAAAETGTRSSPQPQPPQQPQLPQQLFSAAAPPPPARVEYVERVVERVVYVASPAAVDEAALTATLAEAVDKVCTRGHGALHLPLCATLAPARS